MAGVGDEKAVEGVARPAELLCRLKPWDRRRVVEEPAGIGREGGYGGPPAQLQSPHLHQKLQLEQAGWGQVEAAPPAGQGTGPRVVSLEPQDSASIEQDQRRRRGADDD